MSEHFEKLKEYYNKGLWSKERLRKAVEIGWITPKEYELIVGYEYE